jgi:hypothetical protein
MEFRKIKAGVVQATPVLFNMEKNIDLVISWINGQQVKVVSCYFFQNHLFPVTQGD